MIVQTTEQTTTLKTPDLTISIISHVDAINTLRSELI